MMRDDPDIPDLVSLAEAGELLNLGKQATLNLINDGKLPARQVDGRWVARRAAVLALHNQRRRARPE